MAANQNISASSALQLARKPETSLMRMDSLEEVLSLGATLAKSGYFSDAREAAQAVVKILAGKEMGIGPIAAMTGIYIVKGKVSMSANLMAACLKSGGRYDYKVRELTTAVCSIEFFEHGESLGTSSFTLAEAKAAKLDQDWDKDKNAWKDKVTWKNFPKNMLFARALSNGVKFYCPNFSDRASGPIYTPDELGATVDGETGEVIEVTPEPQQPAQTLPPIGGRRANTGAELVAHVEKVADYYEVTDHDEVFEVRKDNGAVVCSCGADGKNPCQHRLAVKLWVVEQKAKEQKPVAPAPNLDDEMELEPEDAGDDPPAPTQITLEQYASLCGLTAQMEAAGIETLTWTDQMENLTGSRSRRGLMSDELAKVIFAFNQALAAQQRKGGKAKAK